MNRAGDWILRYPVAGCEVSAMRNLSCRPARLLLRRAGEVLPAWQKFGRSESTSASEL